VSAAALVALCADDFGLAPGISQGIADLAARGRLNAISCIVTGDGWEGDAACLADLPAGVQRGLHFNLTEGPPMSPALRRLWPRFPALPRLMARAALGRLPQHALGDEWRAQWQAFVTATGRAPEFVDGHQHVHHLPGVRDTVLDAAAAAGVAVRNTGRLSGPGFGFKRQVIERSGGRTLLRGLQQRGIAHNAVLAGIYDFAPQPDYRALMQAWLAALPREGGLLMCHPALAMNGADDDPIAAARCREAAYLGSGAFADDLAAAGFSLGPVWSRTPSAR
jgi:chitin disaccharide deacetylase